MLAAYYHSFVFGYTNNLKLLNERVIKMTQHILQRDHDDKPKLLVVDDKPENVFAIENILKTMDIAVYKAYSGEEALALVMRHNFFLILMDLKMPGMDGIETTSFIRQNNATKNTPIIFVSATSKDDDIISSVYDLGAVDYIFKPINPHILKSKVSIFLNISVQHVLLEREVKERIKAEKIKDEFISVVSHELRTPLTAIQGSIGLIAGGVMGKLTEEGATMVNVALSNCNRLLLLVNDLLDIQKIEQGKIILNCKPVEINQLIRQSLQENKGYSEKLGVHFKFEEPDFNPTLYIDKQRIAQVMANLLSNAAKFTPKNETVLITVTMQGSETVRISVIDIGAGIPEDFKTKVFDKFAQADSSSSRSKGGTGLGLSISQSIINNHHGNINFVSEKNKGTTFFFELPLCSQQLANAI